MLRGALALSLGILLARWRIPSLPFLLGLLALTASILTLALRSGSALFKTSAALVLTAVAGMLLASLRDDPLLETFAGQHLEDVDAVGKIVSGPSVRGVPGHERVEYLLDLDTLIFRNSVASVKRRVLLRVDDTTAFNPKLLPQSGEHVVLRCACDVPQVHPPLGTFDQRSLLASRGAGALVTVDDVADIAITGGDDRGGVERMTTAVRESVKRFAEQHVRGEEGEIVRALITGEREGIDPETNDAFRRTGTIHVLSVSGLHVGIIALALFVLVSWWRNRWVQVAIFTALMVPYVAITGAAPPVLRAAVMAVAFMVARASGRRVSSLNTLGAGMLAILLADPHALFDVGFQLSCASVAGIVLILPRLDHRMRRSVPWLWRRVWAKRIVQLLAMSLAAQLATLPIILAVYGTVSPISPLANLLVVPLMNCALAAGMLGSLVFPLSDLLASWFGAAAYMLVWLSRAIALECASFGWAQIALPQIGPIGSALLGTVTLATISLRRWRLLPRLVALACSIAIVLLATHLADPLHASVDRAALLLPWRGGTAVALRFCGEMRLYVDRGVDTAGAASLARRARGVLGGTTAGVIRVGPPKALLDSADGLLALDARATVAAPYHHLLFTLESRRVPQPVGLRRMPFLLIPLRFPLDEPMVLVEREGEWRMGLW